MAGVVGCWAIIPVQMLESSWRTEQDQMSAWSGDATRLWIGTQASDVLNRVAHQGEVTSSTLGTAQIDVWLRGRVFVTLLWASLVVYRAYVLVLWGLIGIPLILAAAADGLFIREIRKHSFVSQSPIRHKIGIHFFKWVTVGLVIWLCLPVPAPVYIAPAVIAFMAFSLWLWASNLQKRL